ncbi:MAG: hypothetical protein V4507_02225, partial [Verrucomicrobiota bacterium]
MPFNWFHRQKLVKKGLACDKTRHSGQKADWVQIMEDHPLVRILIFFLFAGFLSLLSLTTSRPLHQEVYILLSIVFGYSVLILHLDLPDVWKSNSKILLVYLCISINILITR